MPDWIKSLVVCKHAPRISRVTPPRAGVRQQGGGGSRIQMEDRESKQW